MGWLDDIGNFFGREARNIGGGISDVGHWIGQEASNVGHTLGREWMNVRPWLPEIAAGAGAVALPFLAPELLGGAAGALGGLGETIGEGAGALGETLGLAAPEAAAEGALPEGAMGLGVGAPAAEAAPAADITGALAGGAGDVGGAAAGGAPAAAAGGGPLSALGIDAGWGTLARYGIPAALAGYGLLRGQQSLPPQAGQEQRIATNEGAFATDFLNRGETGQLTPSQIEQIAIYRQNAENQLRQQFASAGLDPSTNSSFLQGMQQIGANAIAMEQQFIDQMIREGLSAGSQATAALNQVAQLQMQEDQNFQTSIGNALRALGIAFGAGGQTIRIG